MHIFPIAVSSQMEAYNFIVKLWNNHTSTHKCMCVCTYVCVYMCVCDVNIYQVTNAREGDKKRERERERERKKKRV